MKAVWAAIALLALSATEFNVSGPLNAAQFIPAPSEAVPIQWRGDAALRDVFFLNHDLGWAVGDQGTILRTEDGGRSWNIVPVPVSCSLRSVQFIDEQNGWAVGGQALPLVARTHAVILRTRDGGRTWKPISGTMLPALQQLRMTDAMNGWAWGTPTHHFPGGIFTTADGGKSWSDFPQSKPTRWTAVAATGRGFAVATDGAQLGLYEAGHFRASQQPRMDGDISNLAFFDAKQGWAIGNHQVLATEDGGQTWQSLGMPAEASNGQRFQFETATGNAARQWLAGSPGSYIFCLDRSSQQWSRSRTPIRSAIHKLFFLNESHGWAVGDLGNILVTRDAGATWQIQRSAGDRVGLMVVCHSVESIPFEILARHTADQGFLSAVVLCQTDSVFGDGSQRALEACQRQGVSSFFALEPAGSEARQQQLIGLIRQLQPSSIVVSDSPQRTLIRPLAQGGANPAPVGEVDLEAGVVSAVSLASDANHDRDWINHAALAPWQTPFILLARKKVVATNWGPAEYLPTIGQNMFDQIMISRALLTPNLAAEEKFDLIALADRSMTATSDLFGGLNKGPLAPPRRQEISARGYVGQVKAIINKGTTLDQLAAQFDSSPTSLPVWRQRVDNLIAELDPHVAGYWLWQLSEAYARTNQFELAAFARAALLERIPDHPLAWESRLWLAPYYASQEFAWCEFLQQQRLAASPTIRSDRAIQKIGLRAVPEKTVVDGVTQTVWTAELPEEQGTTTDPRAEMAGQTANTSPRDFQTFYGERLKLAQALFRSIQQSDPELALNPLVAFGAGLLKRKTEGVVVAESDLRKIRALDLPTPQRLAIARETRLLGPRGWSEMRDLAECPSTASKPYLDGILDDEVWRTLAQSGRIIQLTPDVDPESAGSTATESSQPTDDPNLGQTQLMLAHDDQYLYLAAICHAESIPAGSGPRDAQKRQRDKSLNVDDLLQIALDVDRDGSSYFLFSVDGQGSFAEQIGENRQWNPTWYLAHARTDHNWIVEAAIPLDQLTPSLTSEPDAIWGLAVRRHLAGDHVERWAPAFETVAHQNLATQRTKPDFLPSDGVIYFR